MKSLITPFIEHQGLFIVDGGLATELEWRGHDLNDDLWSARLLGEDPSAIKAVHRDYLRAGADCLITASYQATLPGLMASGFSEAEATRLLLLAVEIAVEARDEFWAESQSRQDRLRPLVAASIGPYGAYLANGAEYTGDYDLDTQGLLAWHRPRWQLLAESAADLLACETIPSWAELEAYCQLLAARPTLPAWVSFSCWDEAHISDGTPIAACAERVADLPNVVAIGINCTAPRLLPGLITAVQTVSDKYIIVYPNSGERYDPQAKVWRGESDPATYGTLSREWRKMGAVLIGGCCRTRPAHIQQIRDRVRLKKG